MKKALNVPLEEFLRPFFGPSDRICLRVFDDRKIGTFKGGEAGNDAPRYPRPYGYPEKA